MQSGFGQFESRPLTEADIPVLVEIGKERLGRDYIGPDDFMTALVDPGQFCETVVCSGVPIGFAICREFGPECEETELDLPDSPQRDLVLSSRRIGLLDSVAIADGYGGRGYGAELIRRCLSRMEEDGCDLAVSMAWVHRDGVEPIRKALSSAGLSRSDLVIEGYWNEWVDSSAGHDCPICGAPCHCFGAFWYRRLSRGPAMTGCPP